MAGASSPTEDMLAERARGTVDVQALCEMLNGGKARLARRQYLSVLLQKQPWSDKTPRPFLSRTDYHVAALDASFRLRDLVLEHGLSGEDYHYLRTLLDFPGGLELHYGMYIPTLQSQATDEQKEKYLRCPGGPPGPAPAAAPPPPPPPPAQRRHAPMRPRPPPAPRRPALEFKEIGTYAQTELGHGTFLRGLETTATYDAESEEFVLHSPTLTATKWWPGGLGKTATHAVVMARLFLKGRDHGPHPFVVRLRCAATHLPRRGVVVGDIGPKLGYNGVDNGFLRFDHLRVPRDALLAKYSGVTRAGDYVPPPPENSKAVYGTMMYIRATIVEGAGHFLSRGVTIATRYCAVRRQTAPARGERETTVLDYQNVQWALLRLLASSYALYFQGQAMMRLYNRFEADRERGDFSILPELHPYSSGLKAVTSWMAADGIEECRRTCGGQGFSVLSGLPQLLASYVQNCTWEGDNNVMCLQMSRFLVKQMHSHLSRPGEAVTGQCAYFADRSPPPPAPDAGVPGLLRMLQVAAAALAKKSLAMVQPTPGAGEPSLPGRRGAGGAGRGSPRPPLGAARGPWPSSP